MSEQVALTTSLNLDLKSKLKLAEGEIESYKKILHDYQTEISEMKVKHLNSEVRDSKKHFRKQILEKKILINVFLFFFLHPPPQDQKRIFTQRE